MPRNAARGTLNRRVILPSWALFGHADGPDRCPILGLDRAWPNDAAMFAVGTAVASRPPQSGRVEARTRASNDAVVSSTLPIIPYGGFSPIRLEGWHVRRRLPTHQQLKPAPGIHWLMLGLRPPFVRFVVDFGDPAQCRAEDSIAHRLGGWVALRPRGPRSGPGYAVPVRQRLIDPIRPTHGHIAISPHGGLYAMPSLCGSAEATRGWFRAFAVHSFLTCRPL
jgi:hypothetical protein